LFGSTWCFESQHGLLCILIKENFNYVHIYNDYNLLVFFLSNNLLVYFFFLGNNLLVYESLILPLFIIKVNLNFY
jgi:hypothetical protein